jgi:hypothetical protein
MERHAQMEGGKKKESKTKCWQVVGQMQDERLDENYVLGNREARTNENKKRENWLHRLHITKQKQKQTVGFPGIGTRYCALKKGFP